MLDSIKKLTLAAAFSIFAAGYSHADTDAASYNTIPVTVVGATKATVLVGGKPYKAGATIHPGQSITVTGGSAVLQIGSTQITANDGSAMTMNAGNLDSQNGNSDPSFTLTKGTISAYGRPLSSGSLLSTVGQNAQDMITDDTGASGTGKNFYNSGDVPGSGITQILIYQSPEQALTVVSPSAPH